MYISSLFISLENQSSYNKEKHDSDAAPSPDQEKTLGGPRPKTATLSCFFKFLCGFLEISGLHGKFLCGWEEFFLDHADIFTHLNYVILHNPFGLIYLLLRYFDLVCFDRCPIVFYSLLEFWLQLSLKMLIFQGLILQWWQIPSAKLLQVSSQFPIEQP